MSNQQFALACSFIVGVHGEGSWQGFEKPCGRTRGTTKDPRQERYDVGLCPQHQKVVEENNDDDS